MARSLDLMPLDYFLWGYVKDIVYSEPPTTCDNIIAWITTTFKNILSEKLRRSFNTPNSSVSSSPRSKYWTFIVKNGNTTRVAQKHWSYIGSISITQWSYIGLTFWNDNGPILAASRWFHRWPMVDEMLDFTFSQHYTNNWKMIQSHKNIQYWAYVDCLNSDPMLPSNNELTLIARPCVQWRKC